MRYNRESDVTERGWAFEHDVVGSPNKYLAEKEVDILTQNDLDLSRALIPGQTMTPEQERKVLLAVKKGIDSDPEYDPTAPTKPFADDLQLAVSERMGDKYEVAFYPTVGLSIDRKGIDAFLICNGEIVTIDVTKRPPEQKQQGDSRSDFVWSTTTDIPNYEKRTESHDIRKAPADYQQAIKERALEVSQLLRQRLVKKRVETKINK